jgi:competence ComEA-like helix-hairpin-helix protein
MGQFYDEDKIKAMESGGTAGSPPPAQPPGAKPSSGRFYDEEKISAMGGGASAAPAPPAQPQGAKPSSGRFYDEEKIKAMGGQSSAPSAGAPNLARYGLIALVAIIAIVVVWWKITHNPGTMIVNINKASATELSYLPGVGEAKAKVIIDHRPYSTIEDLKKVPGIGEKTFEKMKPRVKVE